MIHENVLLLSLILMGGVLTAFAYVFINSGELEEDYASITQRSYSKRSKLFVFILLAGVVIAVVTTRGLPYGSKIENAKQVDIIGKQWYWEISDTTAKVNEPVVFHVGSGDVNHGLGIYDKDLRLLTQVQAMPNYINKLSYTFEEEGEYKLMCMEYCGLVHHSMISTFTVTDGG